MKSKELSKWTRAYFFCVCGLPYKWLIPKRWQAPRSLFVSLSVIPYNAQYVNFNFHFRVKTCRNFFFRQNTFLASSRKFTFILTKSINVQFPIFCLSEISFRVYRICLYSFCIGTIDKSSVLLSSIHKTCSKVDEWYGALAATQRSRVRFPLGDEKKCKFVISNTTKNMLSI